MGSAKKDKHISTQRFGKTKNQDSIISAASLDGLNEPNLKKEQIHP